MDYIPDARATLDELQRQFQAFKTGHEEELRQIKATGSADVVTREKVERMSAVIDALQEKSHPPADCAEAGPSRTGNRRL